MKIRLLYFFTLLFISSLPFKAFSNSPEESRLKFNFNSSWKIYIGDTIGAEQPGFNDIGWKEVTLPHAFNEDEAFKKDIHDLTTGISWYRKHFILESGTIDKKIFLEFEGIRQGGEFYINGRYAGRHENGVMAFGIDISELVNPAPQENVIAVRIDNSWKYREKETGQTYQWNNNNFNANYGGIPKNVYLHVCNKLYQTLPLFSSLGSTGVYVYAGDFNIPGKTAVITAESEVKNETSREMTIDYFVEIIDMEGKLIKSFSSKNNVIAAGGTAVLKAGSKIKNLHFWSWGYGYLYTVNTIIKAEGNLLDKVKTRTGFRKTEFADGMIRINDRVIQMKGYAQRTSNEWPAVGLSVPPWLSDFSNRLVVEGNGNLVRWMHVTPWKQDIESCDRVGLMQAMPAGDAENDSKGRQWEQRVELMRDAIIYNRNNPSIIFYEGGNENISEEHIQQLKDLRDQYDPFGGRASGCREMLASKVAEYGGEMLYINKSARIPFWAMEYSRDEGLRKYWDEFSPPYHKDGPSYNRNQDSHAIENIIRWYDYFRERPGTGDRVSSGGVNIIFSDSNTHFRGDENYRRSGEVDPMRIPKDGFFAHKVMWDGWVDTENYGAHIMGHWNYNETVKKDVFVVSSADKVELFLNGKSLGFGQQSYNFLFTFNNIEWHPGELKAIAYDENGTILCEDIKRTAGDPFKLKMTVFNAPSGMHADGADLALVEVEVVDESGIRCPVALNMINFTLDGPAEWRGGIAQGPGNYILEKSLPVECGVNRVLIRSTTNPGKITLNATSEGIQPATLSITSIPVSVSGGLSGFQPSGGLPSYLGKGPTPLSPSYTVSRIPVEIASAKAGSNEENSRASFDDNEMTKWQNDNNLSTAWINYNFTKTSSVSEVCLKLDGWRRISYPLKISIDDIEVFKGETPMSLGYVTIPLKPVTGNSMRVELYNPLTEKDGFDIVEITGKKDEAASGDSENAKGKLGIIEAEIYQLPSNL